MAGENRRMLTGVGVVICMGLLPGIFMTSQSVLSPTDAQFRPVELPNPGIPGFVFPESEQTILDWVKTGNDAAIHSHAWGLWTALTQQTDQVFNGQKLLVFETWNGPADLRPSSTLSRLIVRTRQPHQLQLPEQLQSERARDAATSTQPGSVAVDVKYNPVASEFITANGLLSKSRLLEYLNPSVASSIPNFKPDAISLKPIYRTLSPLIDNRYFQLWAWPGPPVLTFDDSDKMWHSQFYPDFLWGQCVWIDIEGAGNIGGGVDKTCAVNGTSRTSASTYGLDQFIHFRMTKSDAEMLNANAQSLGLTSAASEGEYAVLVGMHATSREISRWTWQTFWWVTNPDNPTAPSSKLAASTRPAKLTVAARHYAQCAGYDEVIPSQPDSGGANVGQTVYCYNPYLEAAFSQVALPKHNPGMTLVDGQMVKTANDVGPQTNCMSCHELAAFNPQDPQGRPYTGGGYVDLNSPVFKGLLKTDFLWTLPLEAK
jgi:hypothetical protein